MKIKVPSIRHRTRTAPDTALESPDECDESAAVDVGDAHPASVTSMTHSAAADDSDAGADADADAIGAANDEDGLSLEATSRSPKFNRARLAWAGLLTIAILVMASGLAAWWQASHDEQIADAQRRDAVLVEAQKHIETLNTLDYHDVDDGLKKWSNATSGTLHDSLDGIDDEDRKLLAEQSKVSTGKVLDAAVVDLADDTATVIAAVEVTVEDGSQSDAEPTTKRNRFSADLVKTGESWKLESLDQVPVDLS